MAARVSDALLCSAASGSSNRERLSAFCTIAIHKLQVAGVIARGILYEAGRVPLVPN
jgi:hypothetical protein